MNALNQEQNERVAQWLDGARFHLTAEESAVAEQVRRDERWLADELPEPAPARVMGRVTRQVAAVAAPKRMSILRLGALTSAAAAALLLACVSLYYTFQPGSDAGLVGIISDAAHTIDQSQANQPSIAAQIEELEKATARRTDRELDELDREIDEYDMPETSPLPFDEDGAG